MYVTLIAMVAANSYTELTYKAQQIRKAILQMLFVAGSGHAAGALGMADVFTALYFEILKHDPTNPEWTDRDRLLVSNGHICPVWYATLSAAGYFPEEELATLRKLGSRLQGHPHLGSLPGVENTGGPLSQGISQAAGVALGFKMDKTDQRVYVITSDGEHQEGQTWETYMFASAHALDNLTVFIDSNNIQIGGKVSNVMPIEPLKDKIEAFGWQVLGIDGHDFAAIFEATKTAKNTHGTPTAIICTTIPGKGVSFMENDHTWHGKGPNQEELAKARIELDVIKQ